MTDSLLFGLLVAALLFGAGAAWQRYRRARRPFPPDWDRLLRSRVAPYRELDAAGRGRLQRRVLRFVDDKDFYGCAGLEVDESMAVIVAAWCCLLLRPEARGVYPDLRYILLYPDSFIVDHEEVDEAGVVTRRREERLGESWEQGKMILSWADVEYDCDHPGDGLNVVVHEAAHQLDAESGSMNGTPVLPAGLGERWQQTMQREYDRLCALVDAGEDTFLDPYAATNAAEFFAVASEHYVEQRSDLAVHHRELAALLDACYRGG